MMYILLVLSVLWSSHSSKLCRFVVLAFLITGLSHSYGVDQAQVQRADPVKAMQTLQSATVNGQYWKYQRYYQGQITTKTCALASAAMVMNTLEVEAPFVPELYPVKQFTQKNFLNEKNSAIRSYQQIEVDGATLPDLAKMLTRGWDVSVVTHHGSDVSLDKFRTILVNTLSGDGERVIANFRCDLLGGSTQCGHFSPIAAYNEITDEVLIMDVARHVTGPYWVGVERLHKATDTVDSSTGKSRGLLVIRAK